jgi:hypothetical protein
MGFGHLSRWERIAVVTDVDWVRMAVGALGFLKPAEMRVFPTAGAAEARVWIATP